LAAVVAEVQITQLVLMVVVVAEQAPMAQVVQVAVEELVALHSFTITHRKGCQVVNQVVVRKAVLEVEVQQEQEAEFIMVALE